MATHAKKAVAAVVQDAATDEAKAPLFKSYISTEKHTYPPEIQISGEIITGTWTKADGLVCYAVPKHLVEGFERHHHFLVGNIVAV